MYNQQFADGIPIHPLARSRQSTVEPYRVREQRVVEVMIPVSGDSNPIKVDNVTQSDQLYKIAERNRAFLTNI